MLNQLSEKRMRVIKWLIAVGWLVLIASLLYDPITPQLTDPNNLGSPFRLNPEIYLNPAKCVKVRGECLGEMPYGMTARIFWALIVPIGILIIFVFGHELWRRICPLSFFSQIPRALGIQRKRKVVNSSTGSTRYEVPRVEKDSWLGRNHLYLQFGLFFLGLNIRILFVNSDRLALASFLLLTIFSAILVGYLYAGKSWCHYFCPMAPVQMVYTGPRGLLDSQAHQGQCQAITQSICREVDKTTGQEKSACVSCQSPCLDIDAERSYWDGIAQPDQKLLYYGYVGLVIAFYFYYFLYSGNWAYYYSGAWTHEETQLANLLSPGFYIFNQAIPIPKLIACPLTFGFFVGASYLVCSRLEKAYRAFVKRSNQQLSNEQILHRMFTVCTVVAWNIFWTFGSRPNLALLPMWAERLFTGFIILVSGLWLYQTFGRSSEQYSRESLASSLRRQLDKLGVDFSKLIGKSSKDLKPDEVYVLAKVLPGFNRADRLRVYKGVLQEALEDGKVASSNSLDLLKDMRSELSISDEDHYTVLKELGVEDPSLLDPRKQLTQENRLRVEGYRKALEFLLLELVESGTSLQEAFNRRKRQIIALRQEYSITADEEAQVLAEMFNQNGALLNTAEALLAQLQELAVQWQALYNLAPNPQASVYVLLRSMVEDKQKLVTAQLLSILEILGDGPEAISIAGSISIPGQHVLQEMLQTNDRKLSRWEERLSPQVITLFRQTESSTQIGGLPTTLLNPATDLTQVGPLTVRPTAIINVLMQLLQDLDPLVQATSFHALHQLDAQQAAEQARQSLNATQGLDWLVRETAEHILSQSKGQKLSSEVPTLTVQIKAMERKERRIFQQSIVRVGRDPENDIVFLDSRILKQHAIFYLDEQGVTVKDLDSPLGLRIGSETISDQQRQLTQGDIVRFTPGKELAILVDWGMYPSRQDSTETLSTLEKLLCLFESNFFSNLKPTLLIELARNCQVRVYGPGEVMCKMGESANEILLPIDGEAEVRVNLGDQEQVVGTVLPGQTIGELGVLTHRDRSATVVATAARTLTLVIDADYFETVLSQDSLLAKNLLVLVSTRLQDTLSNVSSQDTPSNVTSDILA